MGSVIKKNLKKLRTSNFYKAKFIYTSLSKKDLPIDENAILIQSYDGTSISGNPYYMLKELCTSDEYKKYKKYVVCSYNNRKQVEDVIEYNNFDNVQVIEIHKKEYCNALLTCKYLINNSTFPNYFIKRDGQKYLNTWHGTPLKHLGRKIYDAPTETGNSQRNFLMSDYLLYPNDFSYEHMREDYMVEKYFNGKYVIAGYPRNAAFFDEESRKSIRRELDLDDKNVVVYMPTWRGTINNKKDDKQYIYIMHMLYELDKKLDDDTIMYAKLHNFTASKINFNEFNHIKKFPDNYETYEFLNIADALVTDYSSVFFDYMNTNKKIILYCYDKEDYASDRGMYISYDSLPFPKVTNVEDLYKEIKNISKFEKYDSFKKVYTKYDNLDAPKKMCDLLFKDDFDGLKIVDGSEFHNDKKNILIFGGIFAKNGITSSLKGLLNNIDMDKCNFLVTYYGRKTLPNKDTINELSNIEYLPIQGQKNLDYIDALCQYLYFNRNIDLKIIKNRLKKVFQREMKRCYPTIKFDYVIHYSGYERNINFLFNEADAKKVIYIHSNMKQEQKMRNNLHQPSHHMALRNYDKIAVIKDEMVNEIMDYDNRIKRENIMVVHNLNDANTIINKSKEEVKFDADTVSNYTLDELKRVLEDKNSKIFITIGRFSVEKSHDRLIEAFNKSCKDDENAYLIIIGGHGNKYAETLELANTNPNIIIIKSMSNPYSVLKYSDAFVLSSTYEGLPMTIMEALILGKPVISTKIPGVDKFLNEGYGYVVDNSVDGLVQGFNDFNDGKLRDFKKFDYVEFNNNALQEFYALIDEK